MEILQLGWGEVRPLTRSSEDGWRFPETIPGKQLRENCNHRPGTQNVRVKGAQDHEAASGARLGIWRRGPLYDLLGCGFCFLLLVRPGWVHHFTLAVWIFTPFSLPLPPEEIRADP